MGKYRITTDGGVYEVTTEDTPAPPETPQLADQPGMLSKAASATGQFLRGLVPDTIKGMYNTAKAIGATDPKEAEQGTVRQLFAESKERNAIHASDSDENAARESRFFFSESELLAAR